MKKSLFAIALFLLSFPSFCQNQYGTEIKVPLNEGIYLTYEEFLNNNPSIPYHFDVEYNHSDYYAQADVKNEYVLCYRDNMGYQKVLPTREVWGYSDGSTVFISFQGKPFELIYFGAISILRYHQNVQRNPLFHVLSLFTTGSSQIQSEKTQDVLFHFKSDTIVVPTLKNFRKLIADDAEISNDFRKDKMNDYFAKTLIYLEKYNERHPLILQDNYVKVLEPHEDQLASKHP